MKTLPGVFLLHGLLAAALFSAAHAQPFAYTIQRVDTLKPHYYPKKINNAGHMVGNSAIPKDDGSYTDGKFFYDGVRFVDIAFSPTSGSLDLNDAGQVCGMVPIGFYGHPGLWENGVVRDLGVLPGAAEDAHGYARAINARGHIAGNAVTPKGAGPFAFLKTDGPMVLLPSLGLLSTAYGMNDRDQVVGMSNADIGPTRPVLWENGRILDLGTLGGRGGVANAIDNSGRIVGWSDTVTQSSGPRHAFLHVDGRMTDLGTLPGHSYSEATLINNQGVVVGWSGTDWAAGTLMSRLFVYAHGEMRELAELADFVAAGIAREQPQTVLDINDRGQILVSIGVSGETQLLTPTEPRPANDDFVDRASLGSAEFVARTFTNVGATAEPGEPTPTAAAFGARSVWWTWTAPRSGPATATTLGASFDTVVAVYTGTTIGGLTEVASNHLAEPNWTYRGSAARFTAVAGTTYSISVDGYRGATGSGTLEVFLAPVNDEFAARTPIQDAGFPLQASGRMRGATTSDDERPVCSMSEGPAWWSWVAPADGLVRLRVNGLLAAVEVFEGASLARLASIAHINQANPQGETSFLARAGVEYAIAVGWNPAVMSILPMRPSGPMPYTLTLERPPLAAQAAAPSVPAGGSATFSVNTAGAKGVSYQWRRDGVAIPGANAVTLTLPSAQLFHAGSYSVDVTQRGLTLTSAVATLAVAAPAPSPARLLNLSTRARVAAGGAELIPGFVVSGAGAKQLLVRAVGPTLAGFGVADVLADPTMRLLRRAGDTWEEVAANDNWSANANAAEILTTGRRVGAFDLPTDSKDAALLRALPPGVYTAVISERNAGKGVALVEVYDADDAGSPTRAINLSTRGHVGTGADIMIPGLVLSSEGPKSFLIRAVGPGLAPWSVPDLLADPELVIFRRTPGSGPGVPPTEERILANNNWGENGDAAAIALASSQLGAFALSEGSKDAAFVVTLAPGTYTIHARGVGGTTGQALVELYEIP